MSNYYPSASRITTWSPGVIQGVVGGIPSRAGGNIINVATYGWSAAASAATNTTAFNDALAASAPGDIISIPAGTFAVTTLANPYSKSNRTVRGAGQGLTIIKPTGGTGVSIGSGSDYGSAFNPVADIAGMTKDSNIITLVDGSGLPSPSGESTYRIGRIKLVNEATTPIVNVTGYPNTRSPTVVMTARSGNTVTLMQPLPSAFAAGASGAVLEIGFQLAWYGTGIGLEDLTIDGNDAGGAMSVGVALDYVANCWVKNVKVIGQANYGIRLYDCSNFEIRKCWIDAGFGGGSNHGGILCNFSSYGLVEDNIAINNGPNFEINFSATSNIFAYNYLGDGTLNCNHGAHNSYNLFEGNIYGFCQSDGYFGGESENTDLRNWSQLGIITNLKRFSRNRNILGNVIGTGGETYDGIERWGYPNIGNTSFNGTAQPSTGDWWLDWDTGTGMAKQWTGILTTRTSDTAGVVTLGTGQGTDFATSLAGAASSVRGLRPASGAQGGILTVTSVVGDVVTFTGYSVVLPALTDPVILDPSASGFQEQDLDVEATLDRKENYYVFTGNIPVGEQVSPDVLPPSYAYSSKPSWFNSLAWPPIEPTAPVFDPEILPAGYRALNGGADPPGGGGGGSDTLTCITLNTGTFTIG